MPPIHLSSTFKQKSPGDFKYEYARTANPTRDVLEQIPACGWIRTDTGGRSHPSTAPNNFCPAFAPYHSREIYEKAGVLTVRFWLAPNKITGKAQFEDITTWINRVKIMEWQEKERRHVDQGGIALQVHGGGEARVRRVAPWRRAAPATSGARPTTMAACSSFLVTCAKMSTMLSTWPPSEPSVGAVRPSEPSNFAAGERLGLRSSPSRR